MKRGCVVINVVLVHFLLQFQAIGARYCPEAVDSAEYVVSCPSSMIEWNTAAKKKNCSRMAMHQNCSSVEQFQYHCVINGYRSKMVEVCAPSRIIIGHCVEFNHLGGVIQDQLSSPCHITFPKCDGVYKSTAAYKYPDCYDLVPKLTKADTTTNINSLTTTSTTDESSFSDPIAVIVQAGTLILITMLIAFVVVLCKKKRQSTKKKDADSKPLNDHTFLNTGSSYDTSEEQSEERNTNLNVEAATLVQQSEDNYNQLFDTQERKRNAPEKIYNRDDTFAFSQEDKNIDDDDDNNNDILQTDQRRIEKLQHAKEALSDKQLQENVFQESITSETNI